ncbi:hypothetical protein M422DRAFT_51759 [Sphaerobolus stellatus SS14]|uniref:Uncharacterized protein n=1 Tax=Sphaerobolus stellatus (strain SS14) TaxID=990650 RepID=A0A0C9VBF1_SPHS4|nr:hypothetical protein M422DRAFT_51759 [Sphaerobolus stellatus SS14]
MLSLFRSKSARRVPRADDPSSSVVHRSTVTKDFWLTCLKTPSLHKFILKSKNSLYDRPSSPRSSSGSEVSTPGGSPTPDGFLPLDLPRFPSLEEELPDSWKSAKVEQAENSTDNCGLLVPDRRDDLIGELLEQINLLRQKVRNLGDDNSRLRRELTRKRSQELTLNGTRDSDSKAGVQGCSIPNVESKSSSADQPGATFNDLRLPTPPLKEFTPQEGVKIESPNDSNASEYSYYQDLEYFPTPPASLPTRRRQRAESLRIDGPTSDFGSLKRQRCHSLPTPKHLLQYSESRPKDGGKLELSPHLIQLIQQRCSALEPEFRPVTEQSTPESEDIVLPFWESASFTPMPELIMPKPIKPAKPLVRRPQSRIKLTVLDRSGHCAYIDGVWLVDRFANFGYFEMLYYHPNLGLWGPAAGAHSHNHDTQEANGRLNEAEIEEDVRHYVGNVLDEVELPSIDDKTPSSDVQHPLNAVSQRDLETYLYSNGGTASEAQARRERQFALLDSIMEEEEQEEAQSSEPTLSPPPMTRRSSWTSARPLFASRLTQSTLSSIPEQDDSSDSTVQLELPTPDGGQWFEYDPGKSKPEEHDDI